MENYNKWLVADLKNLLLQYDIKVKGSGKNGNILKKDYIRMAKTIKDDCIEINLDENIWYNIMLHMGVDELKNIYLVNKIVNHVCQNSHFWVNKFNHNHLTLKTIPLTINEWIKEYANALFISKIKKAIDKYPGNDIWGSELFHIPITQLAEEFDSFNVTYLEHMYDNLGITRRGDETTLRGIIVHSLRDYKFEEMEKQSLKTPAQLLIESNNHWFQPTYNPDWGYMKSLLRIFQSDARTRSEFENMVTDKELGI